MPHLEQWSIVAAGKVSPYTAPEQLTYYLRGAVTGHARHEDGTVVRTSAVISLSWDTWTARTRNNEYTLGAPDPEWAEWLRAHGRELPPRRREILGAIGGEVFFKDTGERVPPGLRLFELREESEGVVTYRYFVE